MLRSIRHKNNSCNDKIFPQGKIQHGEFDPGSELTLAARLKHASQTGSNTSGERVSNTWIIYLKVGDNSEKFGIIPNVTVQHKLDWLKQQCAFRWVHGWLASWWGKGSPRRRSVAGLRGWTATMELRHGPYSYGRQQLRILLNGRKPEAATPRERWRSSDCKVQ